MTKRSGVAPHAARGGTVKLLRRLVRGPIPLGKGQDGIASDAPEMRSLLSQGLVEVEGGSLRLRPEGKAYLRRLLSQMQEEAFQDQHRVIEKAEVLLEGSRQAVRRNLVESPLGPLSRLKDRGGQPYFLAETVEAGERLAADFERGQLQPRVTASWEPRLAARAKGQAGGMADLTDAAAAARLRFNRAVEAMGPELSGVAVDVCCFGKGLELVERERDWPARSAKLMLRAALLALARHYAPPPVRPRSSHHWGAEDYRPRME